MQPGQPALFARPQAVEHGVVWHSCQKLPPLKSTTSICPSACLSVYPSMFNLPVCDPPCSSCNSGGRPEEGPLESASRLDDIAALRIRESLSAAASLLPLGPLDPPIFGRETRVQRPSARCAKSTACFPFSCKGAAV